MNQTNYQYLTQSKLAEPEAIAIALPSSESASLPLETEAINHPKSEVPVVPQSQISEVPPPPLVDHLKSVADTAVGINRSAGLHYNATVRELQEALEWYAMHPTGNRGPINWCLMRSLELQMHVGDWLAEFEQVEDGFKIVITAPSGKRWIRLKKTDSLRLAKRAFRTFAEFWPSELEPLFPEDLPGFPISEEQGIETAIALPTSQSEQAPFVPQSQPSKKVVGGLVEQVETGAIATKQETITTLPLLVRQLNWAPSAHLDCPGPHHDATLNDLKEALNWYVAHSNRNKGRISWCLSRLRQLQMRVGNWMAEFEKVGEGFKIVITSSSGKSWTRLIKEDSLKNAQKTFRTFVKSWDGKEPSFPEDLPGFPISEEHVNQ